MKNKLLVPFLGIVLINVAVFWPSFFNVARGDQVVYLAETAREKDSLTDTLSLNRTRQTYTGGDQMLYRPGLYFILAVEKWLFGYNFLCYQVAGFFLHLLVLWNMLRLFDLIRPSRFAVFFVLFFSVLYISHELVVWHHLSAYLLALSFILAALGHFIQSLRSGPAGRQHLGPMAAFLFLGGLIFEFCIVLCFVLAAAFFFYKRFFTRVRTLLLFQEWGYFFWPAAGYFILSFVDYMARLGFVKPAMVVESFSLGSFLYNAWLAVLMIACSLLFPQFTRIAPEERAQLTSFQLSDIISKFWHYTIPEMLNILVLILLIIVILYAAVQFFSKRQRLSVPIPAQDPVLAFIGGVIFLAGVIYIILAIRIRGAGYLSNGLYHFYVIFLFLVTAGYCLFFYLKRILIDESRVLQCFISLAAGLLIFLNALQCYRAGEARNSLAPWGKYIYQLDRFVRVHDPDPGFSFDIFYSERERQIQLIYGHYINGTLVQRPEYEFFFIDFVKKTDPAYYLVYTERAGLMAFRDPATARKYLSEVMPAAAQKIRN